MRRFSLPTKKPAKKKEATSAVSKKGRAGGPQRGISAISAIWLKQQFDEIDSATALILKRIEELNKQNVLTHAGIKKIQDTLDKADSYVSPDLERVIKSVSVLALAIDQKVPDKNVPPSTKPLKQTERKSSWQ